MMIARLLSLPAVILFIATSVSALDNPHNISTTVNCADCHISSPNAIWWTDQGGEQGASRGICRSCHTSGGLGPYVMTHSSAAVSSTKYGTWDNKCTVCHNPHTQRQFRTYKAASYVYTGISTAVTADSLTRAGAGWTADQWEGYILLPNVQYMNQHYRILTNTAEKITIDTGNGGIDTISLTYVRPGNTFAIVYDGLIKEAVGGRAVRFFNTTGSRSFADGDATRDGICEVCHTKTEKPGTGISRFRNMAHSDSHYEAQKCTICHQHDKGFKASCSSCHGNPPVDADTLVVMPGPTGSDTAGAHDLHANTKGYSCDYCHFNSVGSGPAHNAGPPQSVTMGFSLFGNAHQGGAYDGQPSAQYDASEGSTSITTGNSRQCSNIYCHGSTMAPNAGTNLTPAWDDPSTAQCGACHGATSANPPVRGSHEKHAGNTSAVISPVSCPTCHSGNIHVNNRLEWKFGTAVRVSNAKYQGTSSGAVTMGAFPKAYGTCTNLYCHSNAAPAPNLAPSEPDYAFKNVSNEFKTVTWGDSTVMACDSCHKGRPDDTENMHSNGHYKLVGKQWIRKYPCTYCHTATVAAVYDANGKITGDGSIIKSRHVDGVKDVVMATQWAITWDKGGPVFNTETKECSNVYCHSDGTDSDGTNYPDVRSFAWTAGRTECNSCHGHPGGSCDNAGCHDGRIDGNGKIWTVKTGWPAGEEWKAAMPMFPNQGPGHVRANSHPRHLQTDFQCDVCHYKTIKNGTCTDCHISGIPAGNMGEAAHIDPAYHVNMKKNVDFKDGGSYNADKTCSSTVCHTGGVDPQWGSSVNTVICLSCHGTTTGDVDDFGAFNGVRAKINTTEWYESGHGRPASAGPYPSGNPPAKFPGNPCWYCHDNTVIHKDNTNPFRLRKHEHFDKRFEKECVYCHMAGTDSECLGCHNAPKSFAPQVNTQPVMDKHGGNLYLAGCRGAGCHDTDAKTHNTGAGLWTTELKADVKNQYVMMGVCLKCHEDDTNETCTQCHQGPQYKVGFDPGTGFIAPAKAKANSVHYGYKHFMSGTKKGGKFCWDCHDPHGDKNVNGTTNIFMIQKKVATETDGIFGKPVVTPVDKRADVVFTKKVSGLDYARISAPYNGICNVCHSVGSQHYRFDYGDGHNSGRPCTQCHEHRFNNSHASGKKCNECHGFKPVPSHTAFGLPRDCTKCHAGLLGKRMDIIGQFNANSHHVQGVEITNQQCYVCHWESTELGLINIDYHEGYNYKTHTSSKDAKVDLVILGPKTRPVTYQAGSTATTFLAANVGTANDRTEVAKVTGHCLSCHSDQNNDYTPFNDCKTPRQYAWDRNSIAARYSQAGLTTWGKYTSHTNASKKNITKAFSAHGNAQNNFGGGWNATSGIDGDLSLVTTRGGGSARDIQCFDCHNSHGSKTSGTTSSYVTFNGTKNGGNLKETQAGKGGYGVTYRAVAKTDGVNPYNVGAAQCFDCHESGNVGTLTNAIPQYRSPWGYQETFGATAPVIGYEDTSRFGAGTKGKQVRYNLKSGKPVIGGHLKAAAPLGNAAAGTIDGLCTPCHDPHGVSPSLGTDQAYAVPLLKGTWMTSPYKEDAPPPNPKDIAGGCYDDKTDKSWGTGPYGNHYDCSGDERYPKPASNHYIDKNTFNGGARMAENDAKFAGLCLQCHQKASLTDGTNKNTAWKSIDRIHETVKGWGANTEHSFSCSKCHQPHNSGLPRLMTTNCLDYKHRGFRASGGQAWGATKQYANARTQNVSYGYPPAEMRGYPIADIYSNSASYPYETSCHFNAPLNSGTWPDRNLWNTVTPW